VITHIYIEEEVADHPRTRAICERYPDATQIMCERYGNVFNSNAQNFRLQKQQPSLILAYKHKRRVLQTPEGYGIGGRNNFYFSHMMNCPYDCRYCFLQGMYRSAHYVVFVNYEDFLSDIQTTADSFTEPAWFFSGYDCDSLAMEPVTGFMSSALPFFATNSNAHMEIRTKSTQIRGLLNRDPINNVVVAYSFTPADTAAALEHRVPSVAKRINALAKLQQRGWKVGIRLDPIIYSVDFEKQYNGLLKSLFDCLNNEQIHSVSYGNFRLPKPFFKKMVNLYPEEKLFANALSETGTMVSYEPEIEDKCIQHVHNELLKHVNPSIIFPCA